MIKVAKYISILAVCCIGFLVCAIESEAQFLNKISKGLEKVNKNVQNVKKGIETIDKAVNGKDKKKKNSESQGSVNSVPMQSAETGSEKDYVEAEENFQVAAETSEENPLEAPAVVRPHVTPNTKILYKPLPIYLRDLKTVGEKRFILIKGYKFGFWTMDGRCLTDYIFDVPFQEENLPRFDNGAAIVKEDGNYIIIYTDGTARRLSRLCNDASQFQDGVAVVKEGIGKYYCIDTKGNKIWPHLAQTTCKALKVGPVRDGLRCVKASVEISKNNFKDKWGFIDNKGNWMINPIYDDARDFRNGYCLVQEGDLMKFIDTKGNTVYQFDDYKYTVNAMNDIGDIYNGYFLYWPFMGTPQYYDLKGNQGKVFQAATGFTDKGYAFVIDDEDLYVINSDFNPVRRLARSDTPAGPWYKVDLQSPSFGKAGLGTISNHLVVDEEGNPKIFIPLVHVVKEMWNCDVGDFIDDNAPCKNLKDPMEGGPFCGFSGFINTKGEFEVVICEGERNLRMLPGKEVDGEYKVSLAPFDTVPIGPKYLN